MNELIKLRLARVLKRYVGPDGGAKGRNDAAFLRAFEATSAEVLRPTLEEFRTTLIRSGIAARVIEEAVQGRPRIAFSAPSAGRGTRASKDTIAFTVQERPGADALEVMATLELVGSPMDLGRFERPETLTREVVERVVLDALEQLLACASSAER